MADSLGIGRRRLIEKIIFDNWRTSPIQKNYNFTELLFVIQEMLTEEGKQYLQSHKNPPRYAVFKYFVQHLLYRNLANYDSMILITSEKGCITGDALLEMPRDLKKYPNGIPLNELVGKGPIYVYSFNVLTKKLELKKCDGVEFVKEDDVWEVELNNGQKIKTTKDHPFLLMNGEYKQLKDLFWIDKIKKNGKHEYGRYMENKKLIFTDRLRIFSRPYILDLNDNRIKIDYSNIKRNNNDTPLKHSEIEHRFIIEQLINRKLKNEEIIHHKNKKHYDNNIENLEILDRLTHNFTHEFDKYYFQKLNKFIGKHSKERKKHYKINSEEFKECCSEKRIKFCSNNHDFISEISIKREANNVNSNHIRYGGIIKSIKYIGKEKVYDVVNVQDNHNFIVNKFVVSNTGKSSAAIMMGREWMKLLGRRFDPGRHIAYNNADVMNKIETLDKFECLICLPGNTYIRIKRNNKEYYEVIRKLVNKNDFEVLTYNINEDKFEWKKPEKVVLTKEEKIDEIELENGIKIQATSNHLFLTKNGIYKRVDELTEKDELVLHTKKCINCNKEFFNPFFSKCCSKKCSQQINKKNCYRKKYPEKSSRWYKQYWKNKFYNDISFRLRHNLHTRMASAIKNINKNYNKDSSFLKLLGCNYEELRKHLELQFKEDMSWENYGKKSKKEKFWSVDHIIPVCKFNLLNIEERKICYHFTNLQPLWSKENSKKGGKFDYV